MSERIVDAVADLSTAMEHLASEYGIATVRKAWPVVERIILTADQLQFATNFLDDYIRSDSEPMTPEEVGKWIDCMHASHVNLDAALAELGGLMGGQDAA